MRPVEALSGEGAVRFAAALARRPARRSSVLILAPAPRFAGGGFHRRLWVASPLQSVAVLALTVQHLRLERDLALSAGAREVGMRATLLAERLNAALSADPQASEAEVFRSVLKAHPDAQLAQSMFIERDGRVVEYDGTQDASDLALAALAGRAKPSAAGDIQGGVIRIQTEHGGDQFAAVRVLPRTLARVAFASPVDVHLLAWRDTALITAFLLASTVGLMLGAAGLCGLKGGEGDEQRLLDSEGGFWPRSRSSTSRAGRSKTSPAACRTRRTLS